jgi:hypothetical protein
LVGQQDTWGENAGHVRDLNLRRVAKRGSGSRYGADGRQPSFVVQAIIRDDHGGTNPSLLMPNGVSEIDVNDVPVARSQRLSLGLVVSQ